MARSADDNTGEMVKLRPGFATTNVVVPVADVVALQIQPSTSQTANLLEIQNSSGTALFAVGPAGIVTAAAGQAVSIGTGPTVWPTLGQSAVVTTQGTDSTASATETYIAEIFIPVNTVVTGIQYLVGSVGGTDKAIVALASSAGVVLANSALAGTTVGTTAAYHRVALTSAYTAVGPAKYFVLLQINGTTCRFRTHTFGAAGAAKKTAEVFGTLTTVTPPTTFTTALAPIATTY